MLGLQADIKKIHTKPYPKPVTQKTDPNSQPQKPTFSVLDDPDWDADENPSNGNQRRRDMFSEGMLIMKGRLDRIREDDGDLGAEIEEFSKRDNREKAINVVDLYLREEAVRVGVREKLYGGGKGVGRGKDGGVGDGNGKGVAGKGGGRSPAERSKDKQGVEGKGKPPVKKKIVAKKK